MTDQYEPQYVTVDNPAVKSTGGGWIWGILLIIVIIVAIIVIIVLVVRSNNNTKNPLIITNPRFNITSSNQMRATWDKVNNSNDIVNLYVFRAGDKINFTTDGVPTTTPFASSGPVSTPTLTAIASPILPNGSYIGYLVVTNSSINDYKPYSSSTLVVGNVGPTGSFHIQAISQNGEIVYIVPEVSGETGATGTVGYNFSGRTISDNNLFFYDSNQNICTIPPSLSGVFNTLDLEINANTTCATINTPTRPSFVLTGNGSRLGIKQFTNSDITDNKWVYDKSDASWCIAGSNKSRCMQLSIPGFDTSFRGRISSAASSTRRGNVLTVETVNSGQLTVGQSISGSGIIPGTTIIALGTGQGTTGTYIVNNSQRVPTNTLMTGQPLVPINIASQTLSNTDWKNVIFTQ